MTGYEPPGGHPPAGHPAQEALVTRRLAPEEREHVLHCVPCREEMAVWQNLADAARIAFDTPAPGYDALLGRYQLGEQVPVPRLDLRRSVRLTAALIAAQTRLLPRSVALLTVLGLVASTVLAVLCRDEAICRAVFGLGVSLVIQVGALAACASRTDPRLELATTMPVSPPVVFAARLVVVLATDILLAWAASAVAVAAGVPATLPDLVAGWFGQAMFAASVGVVGAVRWSPTVGAGASAAAWLIALTAAVPGAGLLGRIGQLLSPLAATSPQSLMISAALLAFAMLTMRRPTRPGALP